MTATASGQPGTSGPAGRPVRRILLVEDQAQPLRALQINLRARDYEVLTARTGREAVLVATIGHVTVGLAAHTIQDSSSGTVPAGSAPPRLTPTEWPILEILLRRPGQLVSSAQLLSGVWGPRFPGPDELPAISHGAAAPQARRRPVPAPGTCSPSQAWATATSLT